MRDNPWLPHSAKKNPSTGSIFTIENIRLPSHLSNSDPIEVLGFPRRLENALIMSGFSTVSEFCEAPRERLIKIRNVGSKSLKMLEGVKEIIMGEYSPLSDIAPVDRWQKNTFTRKVEEVAVPNEELISNLLERCRTDREKDVIVRRYGLKSGEKLTLEEIGERYGLSRERIRQIQAKSLKRMQHPSTNVRKPLIALAKKLLYDNGGILTDEEADIKVPQVLGESHEDGSSVLDLLCDLGWIQSCKIGDIGIYAPTLGGVSLCELSDAIFSALKNEELGMQVQLIESKVGYWLDKIHEEEFNHLDFVLRYCRIDPRIVEAGSSIAGAGATFKYYRFGYFTRKVWVALMKKVLEKEQTPLHFTEITNKVNDLRVKDERRLDFRRALAILIEDETFAHSGVKGTYGLASWGFRKELTPELIEECIRKAGFPIHREQIYNYVSKYKDTKPNNIKAALSNNKRFRYVGNGVYGLREA